MIYNYRIAIVFLLCLSTGFASLAQSISAEDDVILVDRKFYTGSTFDGAVFSTSIMSKPGTSDQLTTLRFSMVGLGTNIHYDFSRGFGMFSGLGLKNAGFIEKTKSPSGEDSTVKRRMLGLTVPLGFKFGNLRHRKFVFVGGGADFAFNYKEKGFVKRTDKDKFNEWFSDRTPFVLPYLFAGFSLDPGIIVKLQYYPQNFLNTDYTVAGTSVKPYAGYNVNLLMLSLGLDIHYSVLPKEIKRKRQNAGMM